MYSITRQKSNQKHSTVLCASWQQVCSCDGFLCVAVTFKLLAKGQALLVRHQHSNWPFLSWYWMLAGVSADGHPENLLITVKIYDYNYLIIINMVWNVIALTFASTYKTKQYLLTFAFSFSEKKKLQCTLCSNLSTWKKCAHTMQPRRDIQVKRFRVFRESDRIWGP